MLSRERPAALILVYAAIFAVMAAFTWLTPWCADDFIYSPAPDSSLLDLLAAEKTQYFSWGGRSVAHFLLRALILGAGGVGTMVLPLIFVGSIFFLQILLWGSAWREQTRWWHPLLFFALLWSFTPNFGQAFLWRTGAANYSLTSFFGLLFLVPYRFLLDDPALQLRPLLCACLVVVALCAGWSNETVGPTVFMVACASVIFARARSGRWSRWAVVCCLFCLAGCLFLLLAPGSYQRLMRPDFDAWRAASFMQRVAGFFGFLVRQQWFFLPLSFITGIGLWWAWRGRLRSAPSSPPRERAGHVSPLVVSAVSYVAAQCAMWAFLFSPQPADRALTTASVFFCLSAGGILVARCLPRRVEQVFCACVALYFSVQFLAGGVHFALQHEIVQERARLLAASRSPVLPPYAIQESRYFAPETVVDVDNGPSWVRSSMMKHYGLDSLAIRRQWEDPMLCQQVGKNLITVNRAKRDAVIRLAVKKEADADAADEIQVFYEDVRLSPLAVSRWLLRFVIAPFTHFWRDDTGGENWIVAYSDLNSKVLHAGKNMDIATLHDLPTDIKFFSLGRKNSAKRRFIKADLTACEPGEAYAR